MLHFSSEILILTFLGAFNLYVSTQEQLETTEKSNAVAAKQAGNYIKHIAESLDLRKANEVTSQ